MLNQQDSRSLATSIINAAIDTRNADESVQKAINKAFGSDIQSRLDGKPGDNQGYADVISSIIDQCKGKPERVKNDSVSIFTRRVNRLAKSEVIAAVTAGKMKPGTVHVPNMTRKTAKGTTTVSFGSVKLVCSNKAKPGKPPRFQLEETVKPASYADAFKALNSVLSHIPGGNWIGFKAWADAELVRLAAEASKSGSVAAAIVSTKAPVKPTIPRPVTSKAKAKAKVQPMSDIDKELAKELRELAGIAAGQDSAHFE